MAINQSAPEGKRPQYRCNDQSKEMAIILVFISFRYLYADWSIARRNANLADGRASSLGSIQLGPNARAVGAAVL